MEEKNIPEDMLKRKNALTPPSDGKKISVKNCNIFYREKGEGDILLYIHGNLGYHGWFDDVMDIPGYRTIAPDMPNFGFSDRIESSEVDVYADYLLEFLSRLEIDKAVLAGHSFGGCVAQSIAVKKPGLVRKLVLIDSGSHKGLHTPKESYPLFEQYKVNYQFLTQAMSAIMPGLHNRERKEKLIDAALLMSHHCYAGHARSLDDFDLTGRVGLDGIPVLVLRGAGDILITPEMAEETAKGWKGKLFVFPTAGHSPLVEIPGEFKDVMVEFLNEWQK